MNLDPLRDAVRYFTRLPGFHAEGAGPDDLARAAPWLPFVGFIVGAAVALAVWGGAHASPWIGALAGLLAWVLITGGLHLDGLADTADALAGSHRAPERFLEIAHDPHIGAFGVMAIVLQLIAKVVLLEDLAANLAALVLVAAWARWGALVWRLTLPPIAAGAGERFAHGTEPAIVAGEAIALALVSLWLAPALLVALLIVPGIAVYWRYRLGGVNGDCLGASIEVTETLLLFLAALLAA